MHLIKIVDPCSVLVNSCASVHMSGPHISSNVQSGAVQ